MKNKNFKLDHTLTAKALVLKGLIKEQKSIIDKVLYWADKKDTQELIIAGAKHLDSTSFSELTSASLKYIIYQIDSALEELDVVNAKIGQFFN